MPLTDDLQFHLLNQDFFLEHVCILYILVLLICVNIVFRASYWVNQLGFNLEFIIVSLKFIGVRICY